VTTPARTLLDLAAVVGRRDLERAMDEAEVGRLTHAAALDAIARGNAHHPGAPRLRAALASHTPGTSLTRSALEERFLALCIAHGLPKPFVNACVAGLEVDFLFAAERVVVETDGWRYHAGRRAFERDRERDAVLIRAAYRLLRFSHHQIEADAPTVARTVAAALAARPAA
jgi:hypothetical protein